MRSHSTFTHRAAVAAVLCAAAAPGCADGARGGQEDVQVGQAPPAEVVQTQQAVAGQQCVTLRRGVNGSVADTQVASEKPDKNYGAGLAIIAGAVGVGQRKTLVKFDMSAIPAGATIGSATLTLLARNDSQGGAGNQLSVHAITAPWSEGAVTWNTTPAYASAVIGSDLGGPGVHAFDVTGLATGWMSGPNHGVLLEQNAYYYTSFYSSEELSPADRPKLDVCFIAPPPSDLCAGVVCAAADACHAAGTCDPATGQCSSPALPNGTACSDGNACTQTDTCQSGACVGANAVVCAAADACHNAGTCDPSSGQCSPGSPKAAGDPCDDGNACTQDDTCQEPCTPQSVTFTILNADCGQTTLDLYVNGTLAQSVAATAGCSCTSTPLVVTITDPAVLALVDGCNDVFQLAQTGANPFTALALAKVDVAYASGAPTTVCIYDKNGQGCAPRELCEGFEFSLPPQSATGDCSQSCSSGGGELGCVGANPVVCEAADGCHLAGVCDPSTGVCDDPVAPDGTGCEDGLGCTSNDTCEAGVCVTGGPLACQPLGQCFLAGVCTEQAGCSDPPAPVGTSCDDANACTNTDACDGSGTCQPGTPVNCDDGIACTIDSCDPSSGCQHDASACVDEICGTVLEQANNVVTPSAGASVTVACNSQNNIIKGTITAADGSYCVTLTGAELDCSAHFVTASKVGFTNHQKVAPGDFALVYGGSVDVDFQIDATNFGTCLDSDFEDDFDGGNLGWTATAPSSGVAWQRRPNNPIILNNAVGACVTSAPDEASVVCALASDPACVPQIGAISNAYSGQHAYWFGNGSNGTYTGSFLGVNGVCSGNNGGSGSSLGGTLTSPIFSIPAGTTILQFRSWWEIESVDPQQFAFDRMVVNVVDANGSVTTVGTLNPQIDANGGADQPYSSGGFNAAPVWNLYTFDMTPFGGQDVQVQFVFTTQDGAYNGYRGWLIDNVFVSGSGCP